MSDAFLSQLFKKLKKSDYKHTPFLYSFYKDAVKDGGVMYDRYLEHLARNQTSDVPNTKYISETIDAIYKNIIGNNASKTQALDILSEALETASVQVDQDPWQQNDNPHVEEFTSSTQINLLNAVLDEVSQNTRVIPAARPDADFGKRSERLKLYSVNRQDLNEMKPLIYSSDAQLTAEQEKNQIERQIKNAVLSKMYPVDTQAFALMYTRTPEQRIKTIDTIPILTDEPKPKIIIQSLNFISDYKPPIKTSFTISSGSPIDEAYTMSTKKKHVLYIAAGSANICGGGADEGQSCIELPLYTRTTYPLSIERALMIYPLKRHVCCLCPNVLIIKDAAGQALQHTKYQKISVMNAPALWRPKTNLPINKTYEADPRLFAADTVYDTDVEQQQITAYIETALFFGYTNIILDDRGIRDNWLPAYHTIRLLYETIKRFNNRVESFVLCVDDPAVREIVRAVFKL